MHPHLNPTFTAGPDAPQRTSRAACHRACPRPRAGPAWRAASAPPASFSRRVGLACLAAGLLLTLAGCPYSEEYYFRPVRTDSSLRARSTRSARHEIVVPDQKPIRVYWNCLASRARKGSDIEQKVSLHFSVVNESGVEIELFPAESHLTDDEGRKFENPSARLKRKGEKKGDLTRVKVGPGSRVRGEIEFDLPADVSFLGLGSLRYEWAYQLGDQRESVSSKFLQADRYDGACYPYYPNGLYYRWLHCR